VTKIDTAALDDTFTSWEKERDLSGTALLTRGGQTLYEGCWGLADRAAERPVTPGTRFATASVTKMVTGATVVALVEAGLLRFDARVVDLLPTERRPSTLLPEVTVHHLLSHTSGIADYAEEDEDSPGYVEDYAALWRERPNVLMERPADFLPLFGDLPPYRAPGERHHYSNAGYVLLGLVVEDVAGAPFADVVAERVLRPAGMADSGFPRLDEPTPDVAVGYLERDEDAAADAPWRTNVYSVPVVGGADGGLVATAADMDRFLRAYDDGTLLGSQRDLVLSVHSEGDEGRYGYGVRLMDDGSIGHDGGDPGVGAVIQRWSADDVSLVVLGNTESDAMWSVWETLKEVWREDAS